MSYYKFHDINFWFLLINKKIQIWVMNLSSLSISNWKDLQGICLMISVVVNKFKEDNMLWTIHFLLDTIDDFVSNIEHWAISGKRAWCLLVTAWCAVWPLCFLPVSTAQYCFYLMPLSLYFILQKNKNKKPKSQNV